MASPPLHLVLCCLPCYGHAKPLVIFAEHLADAGHEVVFVTSESMVPCIRDLCKNPRVVVSGLSDGLVPERDDFNLGKPEGLKQGVVWYAEERMTPPLVAKIKAMPFLPDMVISDHLTWAGANAARALSIKHACHITWPLYMLEECGFLPRRSLSGLFSSAVRSLRSCKLSPSFLRPPGPPPAFLNSVRAQCRGVERGSLVLIASSFGIEPPRYLPPCVKVIGRGHRPETVDALDEHPELKAFLGTHDIVVYVTFGSRVRPPASLVRSVGEGLVAGGWAVVWSLKQADAAHLPCAALASGRFFVRPWLPQGAALAHPNIRAAITHCGMGGLFECAVNAVPIVPLPFLLSADQPVNARAAEAAGFAVRPRPSPSSGAVISFFKFWKKQRDPEFKPVAICDAVVKAVEDPVVSESARRVKRAMLAAGYGRTSVDAVESTCLYGTDFLEVDGANAPSAAKTLWGIAGGVVLGAVATGVAGYLAVSLAHGGGGNKSGKCCIGGSCRRLN